MIKDTGGRAFPYDVKSASPYDKGMTLRDYFAATCPITLSEAIDYNTTGADDMQFYALIRGQYADAMIAERAK